MTLNKQLFLYRLFDAVHLGDKYVLIFFVPFAMAKGFTVAEVFYLHAIQNLTRFFTEIPSGYLSDRWQRRHVLAVSGVVSTLAWVSMWQGDTFLFMALAWALSGFGHSLRSGTDSAYLHDLLTQHGKSDWFAKEFGKTKSLGWYLFAFSAFTGGYLLTLDPHSPAWANFILAVSVIWIPFVLPEPKREKVETHTSHKAFFKDIILTLRHNKELTLLILFFSMVAVCAQLSVFLIQDYMVQIGLSAILFGYFFTADYIIRGTIGRHVYRIMAVAREHVLIVLLTCVLACGLLIPSFNVTPVLLFVFALVSILRGMEGIVGETCINKRISSKNRATILSIKGLFYGILYPVFSITLGTIHEDFGLQIALQCVGALVVLNMCVFFYGYRKVNVSKEQCDT